MGDLKNKKEQTKNDNKSCLCVKVSFNASHDCRRWEIMQSKDASTHTHTLSVGGRVSLRVERSCGRPPLQDRLSARDNTESQSN